MARAIVPALVMRAIASAIIVGIIAMLAIVVTIIGPFTGRTKRSLNLAEFIHVPLTGHQALDIKCLSLLQGAIPSRVLA